MFDNRKAMELQNLRCVENFKKLTIPQMIERRKLIELLESAESAFYWNSSDKGFIEKIADHLIANGVTIPVRCEDCKHYHTMSPYGGVIYKFPICQKFRTTTKTTDFCSYGERKDK